MDNVYVRPNVQFTAYKSVKLDPVDVKFDKDWDPNSGTRELSTPAVQGGHREDPHRAWGPGP